jgi:HEAT repeat protein
VRDDADTVATDAREVVLAGFAASGASSVLAGLESHDPMVRARAHGASARLGGRTVALRVQGLVDASPIVRRRACQLEARHPRRSVRVIDALTRNLADTDELVVVAAADALGEVRAVSAIRELARVAHEHADARCREAAVAALGSIGDDAGADAILMALDDKPAVRRRAVVALSAFSGARVEAALARALADKDWQVRQAAEALRDAAREDLVR